MDFNKIKEMGLEYAEKGKNAAMDLAERGKTQAKIALRESIGTPAAEAAPEPEAPADSVTIEFPIDAQPAAEEKKTCPQCGAPVSDDALFCNKCGAQL